MIFHNGRLMVAKVIIIKRASGSLIVQRLLQNQVLGELEISLKLLDLISIGIALNIKVQDLELSTGLIPHFPQLNSNSPRISLDGCPVLTAAFRGVGIQQGLYVSVRLSAIRGLRDPLGGFCGGQEQRILRSAMRRNYYIFSLAQINRPETVDEQEFQLDQFAVVDVFAFLLEVFQEGFEGLLIPASQRLEVLHDPALPEDEPETDVIEADIGKIAQFVRVNERKSDLHNVQELCQVDMVVMHGMHGRQTLGKLALKPMEIQPILKGLIDLREIVTEVLLLQVHTQRCLEHVPELAQHQVQHVHQLYQQLAVVADRLQFRQLLLADARTAFLGTILKVHPGLAGVLLLLLIVILLQAVQLCYQLLLALVPLHEMMEDFYDDLACTLEPDVEPVLESVEVGYLAGTVLVQKVDVDRVQVPDLGADCSLELLVVRLLDMQQVQDPFHVIHKPQVIPAEHWRMVRPEVLLAIALVVGQRTLLDERLVATEVLDLMFLVLVPEIAAILLQVANRLLLLPGHLTVVPRIVDHHVVGLLLHAATQIRHLLVFVLTVPLQTHPTSGCLQVFSQLAERMLQTADLFLQPFLEHVLHHYLLFKLNELRVHVLFLVDCRFRTSLRYEIQQIVADASLGVLLTLLLMRADQRHHSFTDTGTLSSLCLQGFLLFRAHPLEQDLSRFRTALYFPLRCVESTRKNGVLGFRIGSLEEFVPFVFVGDNEFGVDLLVFVVEFGRRISVVDAVEVVLELIHEHDGIVDQGVGIGLSQRHYDVRQIRIQKIISFLHTIKQFQMARIFKLETNGSDHSGLGASGSVICMALEISPVSFLQPMLRMPRILVFSSKKLSMEATEQRNSVERRYLVMRNCPSMKILQPCMRVRLMGRIMIEKIQYTISSLPLPSMMQNRWSRILATQGMYLGAAEVLLHFRLTYSTSPQAKYSARGAQNRYCTPPIQPMPIYSRFCPLLF